VSLWDMLAKYHQGLSDEFELAWDGKAKWSKYLRQKFSEISTKLIVAETDGELIGFMLCLLSPNPPIYKEKKLGVISDVYVKERWRRKGIAMKMFDVAVKWFAKNRARSVQLNVAAPNLEGRAVWRSLGFEPLVITKRLKVGEYLSAGHPRIRTRIVKRKKQKKK